MKWTTRYNHGKEQGVLLGYDYTLKNRVKLGLLAAVEVIDARIARHWLCGASLPEATWRVPVGKPVYDADGFLENSLGSFANGKFSDFVIWATDGVEEDLAVTIPLTMDQLELIDPELATLVSDSE